MSESITLFCKEDCGDFESFQKRLKLLNPTEIVKEPQTSWTKVNVLTKDGSVQFTRLYFTEQADPFTKIRARTVIRIQAVSSSNPQGADLAEQHVRAINSTIGIVAEPSFDQIESLSELIGFLAMEYDALIFNGSEFLDFGGNSVFRV